MVSHVSSIDAQPPSRQTGGLIRWRFRVAAAIVVVALTVIVGAQFLLTSDQATQFLVKASVAALAALIVVPWLWMTAPYSLRTRLIGLAVLGLLALGLFAAVRVDETTGNIVPKLAWRWTPKRDRALAGQLDNLDANAAHVDLTATTPNDSPEFLGRGRNGCVTGTRLDRDWTAHPPREVWRRPIGAGWGSFAIVGPYAVTQEQRGDEELVVCYELATGKPLWAHADRCRFEEVLAGVGPRATPTIDEGRVYAMGALGTLNCLDGATGKVIWTRDVLTENKADNLQWGKSCSPLVVDDLVVINAGGTNDRSLVAYDKRTGEPVWHGGDDPASYSSPMLVTLGGVRQVAIVNQQSVAGHDPATGRVLWRYDWPGEMPKCSQPVCVDAERLFVSAGYGIGSAMLKIGPANSDGKQAVEQIWPDRSVRNLRSKFANMILRDGFIYALDDGILSCLEAATGKRQWKGGRYGHGQLLLVGDLLLVQAEDPGDLLSVEATPERHTELGRIPALAGKTWNNPAMSGRNLLVRNHEEAVCYELAVEESGGTP
jgi:outer membrane protein assembly factor BamB